MPKFVYEKAKERGTTSFVKVIVEDGEELTETQALIAILDQIDTRLLAIAGAIKER